MSNSALVNYTKISPNRTSPRNNTIKKITIHQMAGDLSVETCGNVFAPSSRQASSNYGIGTDGRVGMYVEEKDRSWASSSPANDHQAVTIEVANDGGAPDWHVSDTAIAKTIELCVDICKRNGIAKLNHTGDTSGNLTRHNMFVATTCPGPYLQSKLPYIEEEVNKRLGAAPNASGSAKPPSTGTGSFTVKVLDSNLNIRSTPNGTIVGQITDHGVYTITEVSNGWGRLKSGAGWIYLLDGLTSYGPAATSSQYRVKVMDDNLNIRKTPNGTIVGQITDHGVYTIVQEDGAWGKLKSGRGWIYLPLTKRA